MFYQRRQGGDEVIAFYSRLIQQYPLLTRAQEVELFQRIESGDMETRKTIVYSNIRLVIDIANTYWRIVCNRRGKYAAPHVLFGDLIQVGLVGLERAIDKFEWRRGNKFSTYATWWIRQAISREISNLNCVIRVPVGVNTKISKYRRAVAHLRKHPKDTPTRARIAKELGVDVEEVEFIESLIRVRHFSLDATLSSTHEDDTFHGVVSARVAGEPWMEVDKLDREKVAKAEFEQILQSLTPQEQSVIRFRFGLDGQHVKTLKQIGEMWGLTRERIRQIEHKALTKLRVQHGEQLKAMYGSKAT